MIRVTKYPDGTSYAEVEDNLDILNQNEGYAFTYKINSYEDLWHLGQILEIMEWKGAHPIVTIPNLLDAQADRRFDTNQSFGLKMVCEFLNKYKNIHYEIFHPHNSEVVEVLIDNVTIIDNSKFIFEVIYGNIFREKKSSAQEQENNLILMSSDAGGFKPLMKLCDKIQWAGETYSASKSRKYTAGESNITQIVDRQDFEGKDILIIDDICVKGGTFKGLAKLLRERNCGKLYLAVSHITIQNLGEDPVTNYFDKVFTTNSKFDTYTYWNKSGTGYQPSNLEVIKMF